MTEKERLEKAREIYNNTNDVIVLHTLDELYPEFKETEDESIRKEIINFLELPHPQFVGKRDHEKWIAWLEKQVPKSQGKELEDSYITPNKEFFQFIYDRLRYVHKENPNTDYMLSLKARISNMYYLEQSKSTFKASDWYVSKVDGKIHDMTYTPKNKDEQAKWTEEDDKILKENDDSITSTKKFKIGDWIVCGQFITQILEIVNDGYVNSHRGFISFHDAENYHLWTIDDAKDGDVLSYVTDEEDLWIMIYWSLYEPYEGHVHYHALLVNDNFSDKGTCCICINDLKPATKEQRDILFEEMQKKGYTFDFEKKEMKKFNIVNNS